MKKWWTDTAWPWVTGTAVPGLTDSYAKHELVRHVVTFAVGAFVGWVFA